MSTHTYSWLLALPLALILAEAGRAESKKEVKVTVVAILASERNSEVDPNVKCIADEVKKLKEHKNLTGFRQARMTTHGVVVGKASTFNLLENQQVTVTVLDAADREGKVRLTVKPPTLGQITYSTACGKCLPIITSHRTKDGELLILAVLVKPCTK